MTLIMGRRAPSSSLFLQRGRGKFEQPHRPLIHRMDNIFFVENNKDREYYGAESKTFSICGTRPSQILGPKNIYGSLPSETSRMQINNSFQGDSYVHIAI